MSISIIVCLLIIVIVFLFCAQIGVVMLSISNWINKKAGIDHIYSVKGSPEISVSFGRDKEGDNV